MFIDPFEYDEVKKKVDLNLKRIEEIAKQRQDVGVDSIDWFEAWRLIKDTSVLIDELSEESRKLENKMVN